MINLLAPESQKYYRSARLNLKLRSYIIILLVTLLAVAAIFGAGYYLTMQERVAYERELAQHLQETASYQTVRNDAKSFADNLKTAKAILNQEIVYSNLITEIAQTLPSSAVLTNLTLDQTALTKPLAVSARIKSKSDAIILKNTLESSPLFENVSLNNVTDPIIFGASDTSKNRIDREFPVTVILSATLSKKPSTGTQP